MQPAQLNLCQGIQCKSVHSNHTSNHTRLDSVLPFSTPVSLPHRCLILYTQDLAVVSVVICNTIIHHPKGYHCEQLQPHGASQVLFAWASQQQGCIFPCKNSMQQPHHQEDTLHIRLHPQGPTCICGETAPSLVLVQGIARHT